MFYVSVIMQNKVKCLNNYTSMLKTFMNANQNVTQKPSLVVFFNLNKLFYVEHSSRIIPIAIRYHAQPCNNDHGALHGRQSMHVDVCGDLCRT